MWSEFLTYKRKIEHAKNYAPKSAAKHGNPNLFQKSFWEKSSKWNYPQYWGRGSENPIRFKF